MTDVTVILPTRNEAECIGETLRRTAAELRRAGLSYEILVVDDESTDGTQEIVEKASAQDAGIALVRHPAPHSFGFSVRDGIGQANGEMCVIMMADLSDDPKFIPEMWKKFLEGCDVIVGSRFLAGSKIDRYPLPKMLSNRLFNAAVEIGLMRRISDSSNNFKAFRTSKAKLVPLGSQGFEVGAELLLRMMMAWEKVAEIPVSWSDRERGVAKFRLSGVFYKYFLLYLRMLRAAYLGGRGKSPVGK